MRTKHPKPFRAATAPDFSDWLPQHTVEVLQADLLRIALLHLRLSALFAPSNRCWALLRLPDQGARTFNASNEPDDFGMTFANIAGSEFAMAVSDQYQFAYSGVRAPHAFEYESPHTWVAAHLLDLSRSAFVLEWESYGAELGNSIQRCLHVCELANARVVLEGGEPFTYLRSGNQEDEDDTALEGLTVRQLALLSGMEEMSIRSAISRKAAAPLEVIKDRGRTRFTVASARDWLKAKDRYVPVRVTDSKAKMQLAGRKYADSVSFLEALRSHYWALQAEEGASEVQARVSQALSRSHFKSLQDLVPTALNDVGLMTALARALDLPETLLQLRAREALLREELARTETMLKVVSTESAAGASPGEAAQGTP